MNPQLFYRIRFSSTRIRWIRMRIRNFLNPLSSVDIFESGKQFGTVWTGESGYFWMRWRVLSLSREYLTWPPNGNIATSLLPAINISSLKACVEVSLAMFTVHFSYYKRRLDILRYSVQMKDSAFPLSLLSVSVPNVTYPSNNFKKAKYFTVTKPTNLSPNSHITLDALFYACSIYAIHRGVLALQWIWIPAGCLWTGEFDSNTLYVDANVFKSATKVIRIQKYLDKCGWGLSLVYNLYH